MRITIHGAGALGCLLGARLQSAGHDLTFVARGQQLDAMTTNGLLVESSTGDIRLDRVRAVATIGAAGPADLVLFAVKNYDVERAAEDLAAAINPEAAIMTVQNGVSAQPHLAGKFGKGRILPSIVRIPVNIKSPGVIRVSTAEMGGLVFGAYDGKMTEQTSAVSDAIAKSGIGATVSDDIWTTLWEKFIPYSAVSAITTMTRLNIGPIQKAAASRRLLRALIDETTAVARASHPSVPTDAADAAFEFVMNIPPNVHASMLDDLLRGKRLELEWISGEVIRRGRELGIETPRHEFAYAVLAPYIDGRPEGGH